MSDEDDHPMLTKKVLFSTFPDAKRPPHGVKLRWRDKISRDLTTCEIKNWRREVLNKEQWRKTINQEVKSTTIRFDAVQIIREHKERAMKRRIDEGSIHPNKTKNKPLTITTNDDATCSKCLRTFKNKRGLQIHGRSCLQKQQQQQPAPTDDSRNSIIQKRTKQTTTDQNTTSQKTKIIDILTKTTKNHYICPNKNCRKILKPQGATRHVKSCAQSWLREQGVHI